MSKKTEKSDFPNNLLPSDIRFVFSRSSGPGGQNVNKVSTRVTLIFNLPNSSQFTEDEKMRIRRVLKGYMDKNGCIRIHSQKYRSQLANRNAAMVRIQVLLHKALEPQKIRRKTKIPRGAIEKRLQNKKQRSEIKRMRGGQERPD